MVSGVAAGRLVTVVVLCLAGAIAVAMFVHHNADPDALWQGYYHDRHGHYSFGQDLALAIRAADPQWFFSALESAKVWPPVHGLVLAAVLLVGGIDHRLGIVPSLIGWALTVTFVSLIAREMFEHRAQADEKDQQDRTLGIAAAVIAVTLAIASPAFRLFAADVMLECLGAALTAAALWAYGRAMDAPVAPDADKEAARRWRLLALVLTALFFEKGNYWGLTVMALALSHASIAPRRTIGQALEIARLFTAKAGLRALLDPLLVAAALVLAVVVYVYWHGPMSIEVWGRFVSLYPPENLLTVGYAILFVRAALWWRRERGAFEATLGPAGCALAYWHVAPIAVSFLLPKRLSVFLWFIGPANTFSGGPYDPLAAAVTYWHAFADGFHAAPWIAIATIALFAVGSLHIRRFSAGGRAVFVLAGVSLAGVVLHPQVQSRFLTSWLFAVWIGAGAGGAVLLELMVPRRVRLAVAGLAAAVIAVASWREPSPAAYAVDIRLPGLPSDLDFVRPLLPDLDGAGTIAVATTFGATNLWVWAIRERCRCRQRVELAPIVAAGSRDEVRSRMAGLVAASSADVFAIVDAPGSFYAQPRFNWPYDRMAGIMDAMAAQDRYVRIAVHDVPGSGAQASVWRRRGAPERPAGGG
jgi:hypothetical protein